MDTVGVARSRAAEHPLLFLPFSASVSELPSPGVVGQAASQLLLFCEIICSSIVLPLFALQGSHVPKSLKKRNAAWQ